MSTQKECGICCEQYNQSTRKEIICEYMDCAYSCCKSCIRTYLLGTTVDPHCMKCNKLYNDKFLVANLNRSFCDKEYKSHRKNLLVEREMSKLPETMYYAEQHKKIEVESAKNQVLQEKIKELNKELRTVKLESYYLTQKIHLIKRGDDADSCEQRKKFIMACPNNDCRGYLSTQYKCDLCELFTCPHCLEIHGYNKQDEHTCNPDNVASAELIKKDTKPCPKCGVRIFKISGCNQMWCNECQVSFSWTTGRIETGVVHNPHYYQHLAQQNNGQAPRNPNDILCGGLCSVQMLNNIFSFIKRSTEKNTVQYHTMQTYLSDIHRSIAHITYYELPPTRGRVREFNDPQDLRIDYILGKKDKKEMGVLIYQRDIKRKKNVELLHLYEILSVVGIETFRIIYNSGFNMNNVKFIEQLDEKILVLDNLRQYCNDEFAKISVTYNHKTMFITDMWQISTKKYKISEIK